MVSFRQIELLGTKNLSKCNSIVVYNSGSFLKSDIVSSLGLSEETAKALNTRPTVETIQDLWEHLSGISEYEPLLPESLDDGSKRFKFNNSKLNVISGEGFDTIIFLSAGEVLGYIVLVNPFGVSVNNSLDSSYTLKRNYKLKKIYITVSSDASYIRVDKDIIHLQGSIKPIAKTVNKNYSGKENWNYATKYDVSGHPDALNYATNVLTIKKETLPKTIFTDSMICHSKQGTLSFAKLGIMKNFVLDTKYDNFKHCQVGYYNGDLAIFIWNDSLDYSIYSLTDEIKFNTTGITSVRPYTTNSYFPTNIFTIPQLFSDISVEEQSIEYFAGKYVVVKVRDDQYLFDIERQNPKRLYQNNPGWIKYYDSEIDSYLPLTNFLVDRMSPVGKVYKPQEGGYWSWKTYQDIVRDISTVSETYIDAASSIISSGRYKIDRIGDWHIFSNEESKVYSNMTKSLTMSIDEVDPIIINDQTLIAKEYGISSDGYDTTTYTLYNISDYYMTRRYKERFGVTKDLESRGNLYKDSDNTVTFTTSGPNVSNPTEIQKSLFSVYRRNTLPTTMEGFDIIGAFKGIIFYRIGNTINYL